MPKIIIYQLIPRYFGNRCRRHVPNGNRGENGCGTFHDITRKALSAIRELGVTHIWFTGVIEHATQTDHTACGIRRDHPDIVKGKAGSPYAIKDYYDVDPDLAVHPEERRREFAHLVKRTHAAGMKVLIDFVPNHLARQYHSDAAPEGTADFGADDRSDCAFRSDNNFYYLTGQTFAPPSDSRADEAAPYVEFPARATGNDCFSARPSACDWYETVKLNYGIDYTAGRSEHFHPVPDTWKKMLDILSYWVGQGVDGFRCDMAEMVPPAFWQWVIPQVKQLSGSQNGRRPADILFIGEVYNPGLYRTYLHAGFDFLYDKVGLYDTLKQIVQGTAPAMEITHRWQALGPLWPHMLHFLENHDEQRIASPFFAGSAEKAFPAVVVSACLRSNPFMLYAGQELGEEGMYAEGFSGRDGRNTIFDYWGIDSLADWNNHGQWNEEGLDGRRKAIRHFYRQILSLCQTESALRDGEFFDLMYVNLSPENGFDPRHHYAFLRKSDRTLLLIAVSFSSQESRFGLRVPRHAFEHLGLPADRLHRAVELLSGRQATLPLQPDGLTPIGIPPHGAVLWKYDFQ